MTKPIRLCLSRHMGFNLQAVSSAANALGAVSVARPGRFGNPFVIGHDGNQAQCVARYRKWLRSPAQAAFRKTAQQTLSGRNLACWCAPGTPCHADILLDLVNR